MSCMLCFLKIYLKDRVIERGGIRAEREEGGKEKEKERENTSYMIHLLVHSLRMAAVAQPELGRNPEPGTALGGRGPST